MGGRCRGSGWSGRAGSSEPARDGVLALDSDGRTFRRREVAQGAPLPASSSKSASFGHFSGSQEEGGWAA
eukprot:5596328-Prymnesium_polylepis.1